jgi:predicted RNA-binding protein with PUA-like domain
MAKRFWLFKTEPECFSLDHMAAEKNKTSSWDGVRNYQARNLLRDEIKKGDEVLVYYSSTNPIGIAGLAVVSRSGYPDHTAWDPKSQHFDPKASPENPIWYMVDVTFVSKLRETLPLTTLKATPGLEKMMVTQRGSRLSVQPVTPDEWKIVRKLMKKYE